MYIWTDDQIKEASEKIDLLIKAKGVIEMFDGPAAKSLLNLANKLAYQYAPKWLHGVIYEGMVSFLKWEIPAEELED